MDIDFPIFRKNGFETSYYKIDSSNRFQERQKIGSKIIEINVEAKTYFEKQLIQTMIDMTDANYLESYEVEYEALG